MMPVEDLPVALDEIRNRIKAQSQLPADDVAVIIACVDVLEVGISSIARSADALERIAGVLERREDKGL